MMWRSCFESIRGRPCPPDFSRAIKGAAALSMHRTGRGTPESVERLERRPAMAISMRREETSFDHYIAEVRSVWGDGKDPELPFKVRALMEKMLKSTSPEELWMAEI